MSEPHVSLALTRRIFFNLFIDRLRIDSVIDHEAYEDLCAR